jgi:hypothetical protein
MACSTSTYCFNLGEFLSPGINNAKAPPFTSGYLVCVYRSLVVKIVLLIAAIIAPMVFAACQSAPAQPNAMTQEQQIQAARAWMSAYHLR